MWLNYLSDLLLVFLWLLWFPFFWFFVLKNRNINLLRYYQRAHRLRLQCWRSSSFDFKFLLSKDFWTQTVWLFGSCKTIGSTCKQTATVLSDTRHGWSGISWQCTRTTFDDRCNWKNIEQRRFCESICCDPLPVGCWFKGRNVPGVRVSGKNIRR